VRITGATEAEADFTGKWKSRNRGPVVGIIFECLEAGAAGLYRLLTVGLLDCCAGRDVGRGSALRSLHLNFFYSLISWVFQQLIVTKTLPNTNFNMTRVFSFQTNLGLLNSENFLFRTSATIFRVLFTYCSFLASRCTPLLSKHGSYTNITRSTKVYRYIQTPTTARVEFVFVFKQR